MIRQSYNDLRERYLPLITKVFEALSDREKMFTVDEYSKFILPKNPGYLYESRMVAKDFLLEVITQLELQYDGLGFLGALIYKEDKEYLTRNGGTVLQGLLRELFAGGIADSPPLEILSVYGEGNKENIHFTWQDEDYHWVFNRSEEKIPVSMYRQYFELMNVKSSLQWHYRLDEKMEDDAKWIFYQAAPKYLYRLIAEHVTQAREMINEWEVYRT